MAQIVQIAYSFMGQVSQDIAHLRKELSLAPTDYGLWLQLADAYEEAGDSIWADACRWIAEKKRAPRTDGTGVRYYSWWSDETGGDPHGPDDLPHGLIRERSKYFDSQMRAYDYILGAWVNIDFNDRLSLWAWCPKSCVFVDKQQQ